MKFDLHIHSIHSNDGLMNVKEIIEIAREKNLNGVAITDHNTIKGGLEAKKYAKKSFKVIVGSEIKTNRGEVIGLFLKKEIKSREFSEVIKEIKKQKGLVLIPHPFDKLRKSRLRIQQDDLKHIDLIEGFNSRCMFKKFNKNAIKLAQKYNFKIIAGSDAHFKREIGNAYVEMKPFKSKTEFLKNLKDSKIFGRRSSILVHILTKFFKR